MLHMLRIVVMALLPALLGAAVEFPVYVGDRYLHRINAITTDAAGNTYVTGSRVFKYVSTSPVSPVEKQEVFVAKFDATNTRVWTQYFSGKDNDYGTAIAVDRDGNVYVAGSTTSLNFPLRNPLQSEPGSAFILKLSPDASRVLWSTYYGVIKTGNELTDISSIAVGPDNCPVIGGQVRVNVFGSTTAFVSKIDAAGTAVLWEQRYGGVQKVCSGGSNCLMTPALNSASIALDQAGNIYAVGNTNTLDFPTTAGAYMEKGQGPYVRKLSPAGAVLWSTYLANNRDGEFYPVSPADTLSAVAVGPDGSVYFTGRGSPNWTTTPGAYKPTFVGATDVYVAALQPTGAALTYSTFIGHTGVTPTSISVDAAGNAAVSASGDFITVVNANGSALLSDAVYPLGSRGRRLAFDSVGLIHAAGDAGLLTIVDRASAPSGLGGVANAAGTTIAGRVAPGELISLYGWNLGSEVYLDELPAPLLYKSATQINAIAPFGVAGRERVTVSVRTNGVVTAKAVLGVTFASPEIFKYASGFAAALNEDGTANSKDNPAKVGSIVSIWGTGASSWPAGTVDGAINPIGVLTALNVGAGVGYSADNTATFYGAAPGMVAGVFQVNVRVSGNLDYLDTVAPVYAFTNAEVSGPASIYIKR
jgi:uncharacterized protein (TIGR03437 family)